MIVSGLTTYVETNKEELIGKAIAGNPSTKLFKIQTGFKPGSTAALHLLDSTVVYADGNSCGFTAAGSDEISERLIKIGAVKVNKQYCDKDLRPTFAGYAVTTAANRGEKPMPFEEYLIKGLQDSILETNETAVWLGDTDSLNANLNKFDGFLKIMELASGATGVIVPSASASTVYEAVVEVVKSIPVAVIGKAKIVMGQDDFTALSLELTAKNLYHYTGELNETMEFKFPGTMLTVKGVPGLNGTGYIVAANFEENFVLGTDLENDSEIYKAWFSEDADVYRVKVEFGLGCQIARPSDVVLYKWK